MRKLNYTTIFFALMGSFLVLFILIPIVNLMLSSDLNSIIANLQDSQVISSIFVSVYSALIATLIAILFGVPLAHILARHDFIGKGFVESIIDIPIVIPHTVSGIALLLVFTSTGILGEPFSKLGVVFTNAIPGIVIAMLFVSSSFVVNSAREGFESVDPRMEKVARTRCKNSQNIFRYIPTLIFKEYCGRIYIVLGQGNKRIWSYYNFSILSYGSINSYLHKIRPIWFVRIYTYSRYSYIYLFNSLFCSKITNERMENL
jgi:ABC-type sulfate transport system permease component